jgi:hypothetical protein
LGGGFIYSSDMGAAVVVAGDFSQGERGAHRSGVEWPRKPITGIGCCAPAASGHATAPPSSVKNSRRFH